MKILFLNIKPFALMLPSNISVWRLVRMRQLILFALLFLPRFVCGQEDLYQRLKRGLYQGLPQIHTPNKSLQVLKKSAGCESIDHDWEPFQSLQGRDPLSGFDVFCIIWNGCFLRKSKPVGQNMPTISPGIGVDGHSAAFFNCEIVLIAFRFAIGFFLMSCLHLDIST